MYINNSGKRVSLIYAPPNDLGVGGNYVIDLSQPLGLGYIAAVLEKSGYAVQVIDAKAECRLPLLSFILFSREISIYSQRPNQPDTALIPQKGVP